MKPKHLQSLAWLISMIAAVLAVVAWGQGNDWELIGLSTYQIFPLFGLLAFSVMWSHYIAAALRLVFSLDKAVLKTYFEVTSFIVLVAILAHPGLLGWQLWRDGAGLPPGSEINYVPDSLKWAVLLGMTAWLVFLVYEFRRKFESKPWWQYVQYGSDAAMIAIFIHALRLGTHLEGWFLGVWYFYGISLLGALICIYYAKYKQRTIAKKS